MSNNEFIKSGPDHWTSRNNEYTIAAGPWRGAPRVRDYILKDGHGVFLGRFNSKAKAITAAREDSILKGC